MVESVAVQTKGQKVGLVTYQLELPPELDRIYDVFHTSMLRRYRSNPSYIVLIEVIEVGLDLSFEEELVQILDHEAKVLKRKHNSLLRVLWQNHGIKEAMLEPAYTFH
ncbi:ABC transporter G family member 33-like [Gossypium australe]|uniref:ABC transporter G family member 33-like n=1 Tax=Gossypium australe TaxID=47621 RepID=A0A5B6VB66_9ROSI|nr:ABC transporter G family member 33-like [Gossypium australe]